MDVNAVVKCKIVLYLFIYRVCMSVSCHRWAQSPSLHHVTTIMWCEGSLGRDVLETSLECAAETWSQPLQPVFKSNMTFLKFRGDFFDPNYFSPHLVVQENGKRPQMLGPKSLKKTSERFGHVHAGVSQPPVCNGRDDTLQEGLPCCTSFL